MFDMGLIKHIPKLAIIQADGLRPNGQSFPGGQGCGRTGHPGLHASSSSQLAILANPTPTCGILCKNHGGTMRSVTDAESLCGHARAGQKRRDGRGTRTAVAFAGLEKLLKRGTITPDETVVVNCTGHTFRLKSMCSAISGRWMFT